MKKLFTLLALTITFSMNAQMSDNSSGTSATGSNAVAMGDNTTASGDYSTAMGYSTTASGYSSTANAQSTKLFLIEKTPTKASIIINAPKNLFGI